MRRLMSEVSSCEEVIDTTLRSARVFMWSESMAVFEGIREAKHQ